jgi:uncharacterized metal-binding protein
VIRKVSEASRQTADRRNVPLVYSCSGSSSAAQLANALAVRLDRAGLAEMSCIAGVGGDVQSLLKTAQSGRPILVLDGCPLHCAKSCLARHEIAITSHVDLSAVGVKKRLHEDATIEEAERAWTRCVLPALDGLDAAFARYKRVD